MASLLSGDSGSSDIASMIPLLSMMSNQQTNRNPTTGQTGYGSPAYTSPMEPAAPSPMANMGKLITWQKIRVGHTVHIQSQDYESMIHFMHIIENIYTVLCVLGFMLRLRIAA